MATQSRPSDSDVVCDAVLNELQQRPGLFDFFQAVRLLTLMLPESEPARLHANPGLRFPPAQIETIQVPESGPAHMTVNFLGLVGPMGVLPYFYSELVNDRVRAKDSTLRAFFDIFHQRLLSLFYRVWQKHRFPVLYECGENDGVSSALLALLGIRSAGLPGRQNVSDEALMFYTGLLAIRSRPAAALQQLLEDYFQVPAVVEQFTGAWYMLPEAHQCRLGNESCFEQLGVGAIVGDAIWDQQSRVRVRLGPMPLARYRKFLPGGDAYQQAEALIEFFGNRQYDFEIQ
jgi:type VI secretion system protein ImpH